MGLSLSTVSLGQSLIVVIISSRMIQHFTSSTFGLAKRGVAFLLVGISILIFHLCE